MAKPLTLNALMKASAQKKVEEINAKTTNLVFGDSLLSNTVDATSAIVTSFKYLAKAGTYKFAEVELDCQEEFMKRFGLNG